MLDLSYSPHSLWYGYSYYRNTGTYESVSNATVKLMSVRKSGDTITTSCATGFFFEFNLNETPVAAIVTNRHVVENAVVMRFHLRCTPAENPGKIDAAWYDVPVFTQVIKHPDPSVDLAVIGVTGLVHISCSLNKRLLCHSRISEDMLVQQPPSLGHSVFMAGFPKHHTHEDTPLIYHGTVIEVKQNSVDLHDAMLADIRTNFGSSGSPVIQTPYDNDTFSNDSLSYSNLMLTGIECGMLCINQSHDISITKSGNIAIIERASHLLDFKPLILSRIADSALALEWML